ncbi:glycosyltransferase family 4 protein [Paraburkholderia rhizosphaerae]|uniref:Glycosyltransferase involved in cell wall biosynthesis n=1 Tax=Paraburkholderia rhizosphaerae TaxID=480658 RepID=A0A4R8LL82_9BURK|nr:glycosyltransferase family 4 protein [Paraburkholderia rhizosphaerae]TDY45347.1 glycosyltransferase involved in cell wall biosynthesis [Paraburkholderia rhizosphaerae]
MISFAQRVLSPDLLRKGEAIVVTGMPGLYRILAFVLIQHLYTLDALGRAASAYSIAQMLSFFTAIGWAGLVLVRVPAARDSADAVREFYRLVWMAAISSLVVCAGVLGTVPFLKTDVSGVDVVAVLAGWTSYQLARHYFLASRAYRRVLAYDVLLVVLSAALLIGLRRFGIAAAVPLGVALTGASFLMLTKIGLPQGPVALGKFEPKGLEFGLTNFLSGGMALSLVPIANFARGPAFAGVISLMASFCAISALIPRAISLYRLPEMSKLAGSGDSLVSVTSRMNREVRIACVATFVATSMVIVGIAYIEVPTREFGYLLVCGLTMTAQGSVSMLSIAHSNVLMVRELGKESARINLVACAVFVATLAVLYFADRATNFELVLIACLVVTVGRNLVLQRRSSRFQLSRRDSESYVSTTAGETSRRRICNVVLSTEPSNGKGGVATVVPMHLQVLKTMGRAVFIPTHNGAGAWGKVGPWLIAFPRCLYVMSQARREKVVFHLHPGSGLCLLRMLAIATFLRACGRKHVVYLHTPYLEQYMSSGLWRRVIGCLSRLSSRTVVLSFFAMSLLRTHGLAAKAAVVPNPYQPGPQPGERLALPANEHIVLVMGRLVPGKGILESVRALSHLPASYRMIVAGDGPLRNQIEKEAVLLGLAGRVEFPGWVSGGDKEVLLRRASVFCLPSTVDSFGMSFIEAQCHDVAIVAFRHPPVMEVLRQEWAVIVDCLEPATLACAIVNAAELTESIPRGSGREWVNSSFGIARIGRLLRRQIDSIV